MNTGFNNTEIISLFIMITLGKELEESESLITIDLGDTVGGKLKARVIDVFYTTEKHVSCRFLFAQLFPFSALMSDNNWCLPSLHITSWYYFSLLLIHTLSQPTFRSYLHLTALGCIRNKHFLKI